VNARKDPFGRPQKTRKKLTPQKNLIKIMEATQLEFVKTPENIVTSKMELIQQGAEAVGLVLPFVDGNLENLEGKFLRQDCCRKREI
jgi:hypothetical protein